MPTTTAWSCPPAPGARVDGRQASTFALGVGTGFLIPEDVARVAAAATAVAGLPAGDQLAVAIAAILLMLGATFSAHAAAPEPPSQPAPEFFLDLDTGGHRAFVKDIAGSLGGMIVIMLLVHLLWAVGVHGTSIVVNSFVNPILLVALTENMDGARNIFAGDFKNMFVFLGGAGSTLGLVICMLIWAKSSQLKTLSRAGAVPSLFNINEPIIFGAPIVYNPYLVIPFFVIPLITYFAISWGMVGYIVAAIPWISPVGVGAFLGTGGNWGAAVLALINLAISIVLYFPFMKMYDNKLYAEELAATEAEPETVAV